MLILFESLDNDKIIYRLLAVNELYNARKWGTKMTCSHTNKMSIKLFSFFLFNLYIIFSLSKI